MKGDRGIIRHKELFRTENDWSDFRYGNITPSDVDFIIEYKNKLFIIGEMKHGDSEMPRGQEIALERLVDNIKKPALLFVASFTDIDQDDEGRIVWTRCFTSKYRHQGIWYTSKVNTKDLCDRFIKKYGNIS